MAIPPFGSPPFKLPITTAGDLVYEDATPKPARLPIGSTNEVLTVVGGLPAWAVVPGTFTPPNPVVLTGSGNYTPTAATLYIYVRMVGAGGGGGAIGSSLAAGGTTIFNSITAIGGSAGAGAAGGAGGTGGTGGGYSRISGGGGAEGGASGTSVASIGGSSAFGANGGAPAATVSVGGGGGGGAPPGVAAGGGGGGAGEYVEIIINNPVGPIAYTVGAGGVAASGAAVGGDGTIIIEEYFNGSGSGGITALTGDGTASGPGSAALTLATVNANVGSFTNANITVNAKGLITAASNGSSGGGVWTTFTVVDAVNGSFTNGGAQAFYLQTSYSVILRVSVVVNSPAASVMTIQLPNSLTVNSSFSGTTLCGFGGVNTGANASNTISILATASNAYITFGLISGGTIGANQTASTLFLSGGTFQFEAEIPI